MLNNVVTKDPPLAVVGQVTEIHAITGADLIVRAVIDCGPSGTWSGVVGKYTEVGEKLTVFLQDAVLPPNPRWKFMERHQWRVRMTRFKGVPSECVAISGAPDMQPGIDLTLALGVTKYSKPLAKELAGVVKGDFPSAIPKTDEVNFQKLPDIARLMDGTDWYVTEKADGTSCTTYVDDTKLHVCSRNLELLEGEDLYWRMARKYRLDLVPDKTAMQFEIVGPGVQGNPMGLDAQEIRVFSAYSMIQKRYHSRAFLQLLCTEHGLPMARVLGFGSRSLSPDGLRALADMQYANGKPGEGVVIRAQDSSWSFKVLNLSYKD